MERGELSGKTAIVTGAGPGTGPGNGAGFVTRRSERSDHRSANSPKKLTWWQMKARKIRRLGRLRKFAGDVTSEKDCRFVVTETIREFGSVHILVKQTPGGECVS